MATLLVIPSRFGSARYPGKPLVPLAGVPLVRRVVEAACGAGVADRVVVSTDDARIAAAARGRGAEIVFERAEYRCGTERVASVAAGLGWTETVINLQGDEALVDASMLRAALDALELVSGAEDALGTVATTRGVRAALDDPHAVKVELGAEGRARAFWRRPATAIPAARLALHIGVYAFSAGSLARFAALPPCRAELEQRLEQLRALAAGWPIGLALVDASAVSLNVPADRARLEAQIGADGRLDARAVVGA